MAVRNAYLSYKQDTRHLLYWVIHAYNFIVKTNAKTDRDWEPPVELNASGKVTVAEFTAMTGLVGEQMRSIPPFVLELLRSVILARTGHWDMFQQYTEGDPDVEKPHEADRIFTIALCKAFEAFEVLCIKVPNANQKPQVGRGLEPDASQNVEETVPAKNLSAGNVRALDDEGESDDDSNEDVGPSSSATKQKQIRKRPSKGKKGQKKKKMRNKAKTQNQTFFGDEALDKVPLEDYRFVATEDGMVTEYTMAVYSFFEVCANLRTYLQGIWREVTYDSLNNAVAGALVQLVMGMVKQAESDLFAEFPGQNSYDTLMKTITRGKLEKAEGEFSVALDALESEGQHQGGQKAFVDLTEYILLNAHRDLVDFVIDYQTTRSGVPTESMLGGLVDWNPILDLQQATKEERLRWRRAYTINWLYDLVNIYSCPVANRTLEEGQRGLENVDWSPKGEQIYLFAVFGLQEFAGAVTSLAMQKPGTTVPERVRPHQAFQLQCIVDAFTVSRGWSIHMLKGHVLTAPPQSFDPRRDIDLFLGRNDDRVKPGYLRSLRLLSECLENDATLHGDENRYQGWKRTMHLLEHDANHLGRSSLLHQAYVFPASRFSKTHDDGLWELSPYLCAVGLTEGLELAYRFSMCLWDFVPVFTANAHLYNTLVRRNLITMPVHLWQSLQDIFQDCFFLKGQIPRHMFGTTFGTWLDHHFHPDTLRQKQKHAESISQKALEIREWADLGINISFRKKSNLLTYRDANWDIERVPDDDIEPQSSLAMLRISRAKQVVDPLTGKRTLQETSLIRRTKAHLKLNDEGLLDMARARTNIEPATDSQLTGEQLLRLVKEDIYNDVCGDRPLSGINYFLIGIEIFSLYAEIEKELCALLNTLYLRVFGCEHYRQYKRLWLMRMALDESNDGVLEVMARKFQDARTELKDFIYWEDLGKAADMPGRDIGSNPTDTKCSVV